MVSIKILKNLKYHTSSKKHKLFLLSAVSTRMEDKKLFKEVESIEILRIIVFFLKYIITLKKRLTKT